MPLASASESPHADRLLVVIGAVSGACVTLARLASAGGPEGVSWLMVLIQATVAAQGGAALLWVVRAALRRLVGRLTGSHAVRDAYMRDDTATYTVLLLTLMTAIGVQLVAPVVWTLLVLFLASQLWVLRRARATPARASRARPLEVELGLLFGSGFSVMLYAISWPRLLEQQVGASAELAPFAPVALLAGLAFGVLAGGRLARWVPGRLGVFFVVLQAAAGLWGGASIALIPSVGASVAGSALIGSAATVIAVVGIPMLVMGAAVMVLAASLTSPIRAPDQWSSGWLCGAAVCGAAVAAVVAVDVLFAFTGIRGAIIVAAAGNLATAIAASIVLPRRSRAESEERA